MHSYSKLRVMTRIPSSDRARTVPVGRPRAHRVRRRLAPEVITQLVADYEAGCSSTVLTTKYHLSKSALLRLLYEHNTEIRNRSVSIDAKKAIQLYQTGWSLTKIGDLFNCSQSAVRRVLVDGGVEIRRRGGRIVNPSD